MKLSLNYHKLLIPAVRQLLSYEKLSIICNILTTVFSEFSSIHNVQLLVDMVPKQNPGEENNLMDNNSG